MNSVVTASIYLLSLFSEFLSQTRSAPNITNLYLYDTLYIAVANYLDFFVMYFTILSFLYKYASSGCALILHAQK